jgi:hypothetical protein
MISENRLLAKGAGVANIILCGLGLFCIMVSLYYIYYYSWTRERQFTGPTGIILYEAFPIVVAFLLFTSLRWRPSRKIKLAFLLFSTGVSIYIVEVVLSMVNTETSVSFWDKPPREKQQIAKRFGVDFDARSKHEVVKDLRKKGIAAVPSTAPSLLLKRRPDGSQHSEISINSMEVLPLGGVSNRVTVLNNELGEYTIYESDEHGFHNPKGIWDSGQVDVVALGDSFAHGSCVPSDKNFVALIRNRYPATLNLGIGGNGPLLELATLKEYAVYAKPKVVLWFYCEDNDLTDLYKERRSPLLMRYVADGFQQGLFSRQVSIDNALISYIRTGEKEHDRLEAEAIKFKNRLIDSLDTTIRLVRLRDRLGLIYGQSHDAYIASKITEVEINLFREVLLEAKIAVSAWGGRLYFVYLPSWLRYAKPELAEKNRDRVLASVKALGLPVIDIHPTFEAHGDPLSLFPFREYAHYNLEGDRLVAEGVLHAHTICEGCRPSK